MFVKSAFVSCYIDGLSQHDAPLTKEALDLPFSDDDDCSLDMLDFPAAELNDEIELVPLSEEPEETIEGIELLEFLGLKMPTMFAQGTFGIVKFHIFANRRHVLTATKDNQLEMWDIVQVVRKVWLGGNREPCQ
jgi:hypothetical protein